MWGWLFSDVGLDITGKASTTLITRCAVLSPFLATWNWGGRCTLQNYPICFRIFQQNCRNKQSKVFFDSCPPPSDDTKMQGQDEQHTSWWQLWFEHFQSPAWRMLWLPCLPLLTAARDVHLGKSQLRMTCDGVFFQNVDNSDDKCLGHTVLIGHLTFVLVSNSTRGRY